MSRDAVASTRAYVAAGSNVEPLRNLRRALDALAERHPALRTSPAYRNPAAGFAGEEFVNLVVELDVPGDVRELLRELHAVEERCGRPRLAPKWAPRAMDLDVLLFGDRVIVEPGIEVPRPDLVRRAYMLKPMADLAPGLRHPTLGATMAELWQRFDPAAHPLAPVDLEWRRAPG
jgi:2-amino-4-hydroxy-6-hydroxymethyldihydropteridine diphosphokinase